MTFQEMLICHPDNLRVSFKSPGVQGRILKAADTWNSVRRQVQKQGRRKPSANASPWSLFVLAMAKPSTHRL